MTYRLPAGSMLAHQPSGFLPSRNLDRKIHAFFFGVREADVVSSVPFYTMSVDAALKLVSLVLPGWVYRVATCSLTDDVFIMPEYTHTEYSKQTIHVFGPEPADYFEEGPALDISMAPAGYPALALCGCLVEIAAAYLERRVPENALPYFRELHDAGSNEGPRLTWSDPYRRALTREGAYRSLTSEPTPVYPPFPED